MDGMSSPSYSIERAGEMRQKINIIFPTINIDTEDKLVTALTDMGYDVTFTYSDNDKDLIEILFKKEASKEITAKIVLLLKRFLDNVKAHIGVDTDIEKAVAFLRGINATCKYLSLYEDDDIRENILEERGLSTVSLYPDEELKSKGYENKKIVDELIKIELEIWEKRGEIAEKKRR